MQLLILMYFNIFNSKELHSDGDEIRTSSSESDTSEDEVWDEESVDELHRSSEGAPQLPAFTISTMETGEVVLSYFFNQNTMYLIPQSTVF